MKKENSEFEKSITAFLPTVNDVFNYPYHPLIDFALALVSLKDKEMDALIRIEKEGKTQEQAAEIMKVSTRAVSDYLKSARIKTYFVWKDVDFIKHMACVGRECKIKYAKSKAASD